MWSCCDCTSSDDDEHSTDNNFLLLFADVEITPTSLECLSEVDVLRIAIGCRFALGIFTISQQYSPTPDLEPIPLDAELESLLRGLVPQSPDCGHHGQVTWTALVERNSHSKTALCVVRPRGYTVTTAVILCSTTPALSALNDYSLRPQHNCSTGSAFGRLSSTG